MELNPVMGEKEPVYKLPCVNALAEESIENFDRSTQDLILIGEMSELTSALLDFRRGRDSVSHIVEEFSHVLISMEVCRRCMGISPYKIELEAAKKLEKYGWTLPENSGLPNH